MKEAKEMSVPRRLDRRALSRGMRGALRFAAGFVLAQAKVFGEATPFGVAFTAATGGEGGLGICGAAGAAVGALVAWRLGDGMKYIAALALALVAVKAFGGTQIADTRFFGAAVAAGSLGVVGFVFVAAEGFPLTGTLAYISEIALAGGSALVIPCGLKGGTGEQTSRERSIRAAARLLFSALVLLGLSGVPFFAGMAVGRIAAAVLVLSAAAGGGMGGGAAAGVALGMVFDIGGGGGFYSMCYGIAGLLAGIAGGGSRLYTALAYVLASAAAALIDGAHFSVLYETFVATVLFMVIPQGRLRLIDFLAPEEVGSSQRFERRELAAYHRALGAALSETAASIVPVQTPPPSPDRTLLRAAARACKGCALRAVCWERERDQTLAGLRASYSKISARGGAEQSDLPPSFRARCLRPEEFCTALGEEHRVSQMERRRAREEERRRAAAALRLQDTAELIGGADQLVGGVEFDAAAQRKARRALLYENCGAEVTACRLPGGRLCLELHTLRMPSGVKEALQRALEVELRDPEQTEDGHLLLYERGRFELSAGAATRRRRGSPQNGDCGTYFPAPRGRFCCLLADGMGSGVEAAEESARTLRLAEELIGAGVGALYTAEMISDLAAERSGAVFSTLDLLLVDDMDERGELVKLGAAATYLRVDGGVVRADGAPSPMIAGARPRRVSLNLAGCDLILMITDGVCDGEDGWLRELVENHTGSAEELSRRVIAEAARRTGESDDMTAVALFLDR